MPASPAGACCLSFEQPAPGDLDTRWAKAGVWARVFKHLATDADNEYAMIDFDHRARPSTLSRRPKKVGEDEAIGRSKGGLSTKINATVDALGNPTGFMLSPGQACDLDGADILLPQIEADIVIADKGFDADDRVIVPLEKAGKTAVIPPTSPR